MTDPTQPDPFAGRVVVGIDGSERSAEALRWAAEYARRATTPLVVAHGWEMPIGSVRTMSYDAQVVDEAHASAQDVLDGAVRQVHEAVPGVEVHSALVPGGPVTALLRASATARCVVVGSRGRGALAHVLLGSTSDSVAARAECPAIVVPGGAQWQEGPVLLATDGTKGAQPATRWAFAEAERLGAAVEVVTSVETPTVFAAEAMYVPPSIEELTVEVQESVERSLEAARRAHPGVEVRVVAAAETLEQLVEDRSARAALVVTGSRGRGAAVGLLTGSASRQVIAGSRCPVAVVR